MKILIKTAKALLGIIAALAALIFGTVSEIDTLHYTQEPHYQANLTNLRALPVPQPDTAQVLAGWARQAIIPPQAMPMAAYRPRNAYAQVHDTLYAHVLVFKQGTRKVAVVSLDLLIFPFTVKEALEKTLPVQGWHIGELYLGASHTHNGLGGWVNGWADKYFAGNYSPEGVEYITNAVLLALKNAENSCLPAEISGFSAQAPQWVGNRVKADSPINSSHSGLSIKKSDGSVCILGTYTAHPTCLPSRSLELSNDYPFFWRKSLESTDTTAIFMAGAVGSHGPKSTFPDKGWARPATFRANWRSKSIHIPTA